MAIWLITWLPAAAAALPGGQAAKDGRFMEAQTSLILRSHKTLTYLLCRLTGREAVSECTVPETSSSSFWNTHRLVSQHHKSTLRLPFASYWDGLLWWTADEEKKDHLETNFCQNVKQRKCSCNTDPQYANLSEITQPNLIPLGLLWWDVTFWQRCMSVRVSKKTLRSATQTHQLDSDITGDVFTFRSHKIFI